MRLKRFLAAAIVGGSSIAGSTALAQPILTPHRAVYDIVLGQASDRSGITSISGRMVYEFDGSACDGYTVTFRFVSQIDTSEVSRITDQQTTTYEDPKGDSFDFVTKSYVDQQLDREIKGTARRQDGSTIVDVDEPDEAEIELAQTHFPTQHLVELIEKAKAGESFYETSLFDGSEDADRIMTTTVIIGKQETTRTPAEEFPAAEAIATQAYWPVSIAYFDLSDVEGEEVPDYRIDFKLHENGITRDLVMDYGEFSMNGKLVDLTIFDRPSDCSN
ncbi:cell envelope integrity EipB family protein [Aquibium sp. ELW1220]|uniref:cell envelope integrity EipB family protein n=1 Tax=Aquibium sp. ELW1220 TaxID=2976766 RepID=UPI0025B1FB27|nr:cell envelope integrity EipB family protein [Aquibium sp. ELW1220]MDN2581541.1 cell envelope integrity EipB family protein [Aquibium sp. ELW1220]